MSPEKRITKPTLTKLLYAVGIGGVLGGSASFWWLHHKSPLIWDALVERARQDPLWGFALGERLLETSPALNDALAVRATQSATQYGKVFLNTLSPKGRQFMIAHPYDKQGTGVSVTVVSTDPRTKRKRLLFMRPLKTRGQPQDGLAPTYKRIGGYIHGGGVEGSPKDRPASLASEEQRDAREDQYLLDKKNQTLTPSSPPSPPLQAPTTLSAEDLEKIGQLISQRHQRALIKNPSLRHQNPEKMKAYLASKGVSFTRDYNFIDAAIREFREETGFQGTITPDMVTVMYVSDDWGVENTARLHTMVVHVMIDLKEKDVPIYPMAHQGPRKAESFQANGTETGTLQWVFLDDLQTQNGKIQYQGIPIHAADVPLLNHVARSLRNAELTKASRGLIHTVQDLKTWGMDGAHLFRPKAELTSQNLNRHHQDLCCATQVGNLFSTGGSLTKNHLKQIAQQCQAPSTPAHPPEKNERGR